MRSLGEKRIGLFPIMSEDQFLHVFAENVRERAITLISKAYSSLGLTVFASMTGLTLEEARRVAVERGWTVDGTMVQPCKIQKEESNLANDVCRTEDQLYKLTQFVSFLENWTDSGESSMTKLTQHEDTIDSTLNLVLPRNRII